MQPTHCFCSWPLTIEFDVFRHYVQGFSARECADAVASKFEEYSTNCAEQEQQQKTEKQQVEFASTDTSYMNKNNNSPKQQQQQRKSSTKKTKNKKQKNVAAQVLGELMQVSEDSREFIFEEICEQYIFFRQLETRDEFVNDPRSFLSANVDGMSPNVRSQLLELFYHIDPIFYRATFGAKIPGVASEIKGKVSQNVKNRTSHLVQLLKFLKKREHQQLVLFYHMTNNNNNSYNNNNTNGNEIDFQLQQLHNYISTIEAEILAIDWIRDGFLLRQSQNLTRIASVIFKGYEKGGNFSSFFSCVDAIAENFQLPSHLSWEYATLIFASYHKLHATITFSNSHDEVVVVENATAAMNTKNSRNASASSSSSSSGQKKNVNTNQNNKENLEFNPNAFILKNSETTQSLVHLLMTSLCTESNLFIDPELQEHSGDVGKLLSDSKIGGEIAKLTMQLRSTSLQKKHGVVFQQQQQQQNQSTSAGVVAPLAFFTPSSSSSMTPTPATGISPVSNVTSPYPLPPSATNNNHIPPSATTSTTTPQTNSNANTINSLLNSSHHPNNINNAALLSDLHLSSSQINRVLKYLSRACLILQGGGGVTTATMQLVSSVAASYVNTVTAAAAGGAKRGDRNAMNGFVSEMEQLFLKDDEDVVVSVENPSSSATTIVNNTNNSNIHNSSSPSSNQHQQQNQSLNGSFSGNNNNLQQQQVTPSPQQQQQQQDFQFSKLVELSSPFQSATSLYEIRQVLNALKKVLSSSTTNSNTNVGTSTSTGGANSNSNLASNNNNSNPNIIAQSNNSNVNNSSTTTTNDITQMTLAPSLGVGGGATFSNTKTLAAANRIIDLVSVWCTILHASVIS